MSESGILKTIRLAVQLPARRLFRNNVGSAIAIDRNGQKRRIRFGLCKGSSDLIGWTTTEITKEMVGQKIAVFTAVEVKGEKTVVKDDQKNFNNAVRKAGGIAGIARSPAMAEAIISGGIMTDQQESLRLEIEAKTGKSVGAIENRSGVWWACVDPEGWQPVPDLLDMTDDEAHDQGLIDLGL